MTGAVGYMQWRSTRGKNFGEKLALIKLKIKNSLSFEICNDMRYIPYIILFKYTRYLNNILK